MGTTLIPQSYPSRTYLGIGMPLDDGLSGHNLETMDHGGYLV